MDAARGLVTLDHRAARAARVGHLEPLRALRRCVGRGFDADDVLRICGRHLRLVVCRRDRYVEVAGSARERSPHS
jgi:hypothetical protein